MRVKREESGASAVEFALIASLLFLVVFGIIQFGLAYNRVQGLQAGAREGARIGSLRTSNVGDVQTRLNNTLSATISNLPLCSGAPFGTTPATNNGCLWVSRRAAAGGAKTTFTSTATQPCDSGAGAVKGDSIVVDVSYRMLIQLPPVMSFPVTITSSGEFACEL